MRKFMITVNGKQYEVDCEEIRDGVAQTVTSECKAIPQATEAKAESKPAPAAPVAGGSAGALKITSPMPGSIVKVEVSVGDSVKSGQTLVVLEAMKMENEIKAPQDGVVASINTSKGSSVNSGDLLVSLN